MFSPKLIHGVIDNYLERKYPVGMKRFLNVFFWFQIGSNVSELKKNVFKTFKTRRYLN